MKLTNSKKAIVTKGWRGRPVVDPAVVVVVVVASVVTP